MTVAHYQGGTMDINELGAESYYFNKLWGYWSDKCTNGEITESQMENELDKIENMLTIDRKEEWEGFKYD